MSAALEPWNPNFGDGARGLQASEIRELLKLVERPDVISFAGGMPDPVLFPLQEVHAAYDAILGDVRHARKVLQYTVSEGDPDLREWIAIHMRHRGVHCDMENILITNGSQQALEFVAKLFVSPGDRIVLSAPTYLGALQAFRTYEPRLGQLNVSTNDGVKINDYEPGGRDAFVYVVPNFANPTGATLSEGDRRELLSLARQRNVPVIEDDPYGELRFEGQPQPAIQAIDLADAGGIEQSRVIYCGSFSKIFSPGLRLGWICAARSLIRRLTLIKQCSDLNSPAINQRVMLRLASSIYDLQISRARALYRAKRDAMLAGFSSALPEGSHWSRPEGGMFVWVEVPPSLDPALILQEAVEVDRVAYVPGTPFYADRRKSNALRLSFSLPCLGEIEEGLRRLGTCLSRVS